MILEETIMAQFHKKNADCRLFLIVLFSFMYIYAIDLLFGSIWIPSQGVTNAVYV